MTAGAGFGGVGVGVVEVVVVELVVVLVTPGAAVAVPGDVAVLVAGATVVEAPASAAA